jgi:type II restriction/modification system DNA methylase subunit YeeA
LAQIEEMQQLEESNNSRFNNLYGLEDEIDPKVPLEQITLTCNPAYRYNGDKTAEEKEEQFKTDSVKELISYAVGCIFGRYSLDKQGLILANQGEALRDYLTQVPSPSFTPVEDNVVVNSEEPVPGDLYERVCEFLRVAFGTEHEVENLQFIAQALYPKGGKKADLRNYLVNDFYADHVKMYNKLPIYQMISGAKGSFNALFYLHRYTPDTLNVTFTKLRGYLDLLKAKREMDVHNMGDPETLKPAQRKILAAWDKKISDLVAFEEEKLRPLADRAPQMDLDDGINANYDKLASVLSKR